MVVYSALYIEFCGNCLLFIVLSLSTTAYPIFSFFFRFVCVYFAVMFVLFVENAKGFSLNISLLAPRRIVQCS
jgi:hypothetical protein